MNVYILIGWLMFWRRWAITPSTNADTADMVIINTCHIREKAAEKVFFELGRLRLWKEREAAAGHNDHRRGRMCCSGRR